MLFDQLLELFLNIVAEFIEILYKPLLIFLFVYWVIFFFLSFFLLFFFLFFLFLFLDGILLDC